MKLPFKIDLSNKVVVVTGAGGVLCSLFSRAAAMCGAKVALLDRNLAQAEIFANEINADGFVAKAYFADVLDKNSLATAHNNVIKDFGKCDILINGAGGNSPLATTTKEYYEDGDTNIDDLTTFFKLDRVGVESVFNLNFMGTLLPTQQFALDMIGRQNCQIINISSMNSFCPLTKIPAYSAAKAAISNFTKWLAVHFSKQNIRVNAIAPGFFVTKQNEKLLFNADGTPSARTGKILAATPMNRFGEDKELIGTLLYLLCNEASSFITGVVIPVDGGFSAYSGV